jgi:predicted lipoprotein with Yx(FWY)xxD motif
MKRTLSLFGILLASTVAIANPTTPMDGYMADKSSKTLYTFDKDQAGTSNCQGACLAAWPAFAVKDASKAGGDFSIVTRSDGSQQWAYKSMPLYYYAGDAQAGDRNGDGKGGVWHVVRMPEKPSADSNQGFGGSDHQHYGY